MQLQTGIAWRSKGFADRQATLLAACGRKECVVIALLPAMNASVRTRTYRIVSVTLRFPIPFVGGREPVGEVASQKPPASVIAI